MAKPLEYSAFQKWTTQEVAQFLDDISMSQYRDAFLKNDILGKHLTQLSKQDLKDGLEVTSLGDRLAFTKEIGKLKTKEKASMRKQAIMDVKQGWNGSSFDKMVQTCCGLFPWDPDRYILYASNMRIKHYEFCRLCGICKCTCCGGSWVSDNIPLHKITDLDSLQYTVGWCCFKEDKVKVSLTGTAGNDADSETARQQKTELFFNAEEGQEFEKQLRQAREAHKELVGLQGKMD